MGASTLVFAKKKWTRNNREMQQSSILEKDTNLTMRILHILSTKSKHDATLISFV